MHSSQKTLCLLVLVLLLLTPLQSFAEEDQSGNDFIRVVARDGSAQVKNQHPIRISAQKIEQALQTIQIVPASKFGRKKAEALPLFSEEAAEHLAGELAAAFRRVKANQDILFQITDLAPFIGDLLEREVVSNGRAFWRNGRLNILFAALHHKIKKRWLYGQEVGIISPPPMPSRQRIASAKYRINPQPGIELAKTRSGKVRPDWIQINLRAINEVAAPTTKQGVQTKPGVQPAPSPQSVTIERRLKKLKSLRDKGLISEQQYRTKVEQILEDL